MAKKKAVPKATKKTAPKKKKAVKMSAKAMRCRVPRCKLRSKGPRFGYRCDKHRIKGKGMTKAKVTTKTKVKAARKRISRILSKKGPARTPAQARKSARELAVETQKRIDEKVKRIRPRRHVDWVQPPMFYYQPV